MWGVIKTLTDRGFGFISAEGLGKDLFFHSNELNGVTFDELRAGDVVGFDVGETAKGAVAIDVQRDGGARQDELAVAAADAPSTTSDARETIQIIKVFTRELLRRLSKTPTDLYQMHPEMFEALVAEIFMSEGFVTEFIKSWNQADGGVDIIAVRSDVAGLQVRYAIQCKRYAATRHITAEPIRALAGVLDRFRAHVGVVATTSYFTEPAKNEVRAHFWKIGLRDYDDIVEALTRLTLLTPRPRA